MRYGQVPNNTLKQYSIADEDLTDLGIKQAQDLRDKMNNMKFDIIISSPLNRAKHIAEIIKKTNHK